MEDPIPEDVRKFLKGCVRSLMALELLLLVRRGPSRERTAADLALELRSSVEWTEQELRHLVSCGLVAASGGAGGGGGGDLGGPASYRYAKQGEETERVTTWLASSYPERRFSIIRVIYPSAGDPIQDFADAFRIRKDQPHG